VEKQLDMHSSISVELRHVTESWTVAMAHADLIDGRLTNEDLKSENRTRKVEIIEVRRDFLTLALFVSSAVEMQQILPSIF